MEFFRFLTRDVHTVAPSDTVRDAARLMAMFDIGALPVTVRGRPVGMITDRDVATRVVALDRTPSEVRVEEVMTQDVAGVCDLEEVDEALRTMRRRGVRRIVALGDGYVTGICTIEDIARREPAEAGRVLRRLAIARGRSR